MNFKSLIKSILIYKEPEGYNKFELLEDEIEDNMQQNNEKKQNQQESQSKRGSQDEQDSQDSQGLKKQKSTRNKNKNADDSEPKHVSRDIITNQEEIKMIFHAPTNQDLVIRNFLVMQQIDAFIVYIDGMVDKTVINDFILRQLMEKKDKAGHIRKNAVDYIKNNLLTTNQIIIESNLDVIKKQILNGQTALFVDGEDKCILIESRGYPSRNISTPMTETVIRGPQEAFVENIRTNITMIRRIIRNENLISEMLPIGKVSNTTCAILYIEGITNPEIVKEVKRRINNIDFDFISIDGVLDHIIEEHPFSLFPQILFTERPDRTASFLIEGNVAIICDGSPYADIVPVTIHHMFHTSEDHSLRWHFGTLLRIIRLIATFFSIFLPGLYLALILYHQEMIPTELLSALANAREKIPFPVYIEVLLMEISWELIREAGVRVPSVIGQTIGIIGAVILGQAAVSAGLVSPVLIIIVAITGLGNFAVPNFSLAFANRLARFVFILLGALAGFYGIAAGIFIFGGLMCSMKSFGVPYLSPIAPKTKSTGDIIIRMPTWMQKTRPDFLNPQERARTGDIIRKWKYKKSRNERE